MRNAVEIILSLIVVIAKWIFMILVIAWLTYSWFNPSPMTDLPQRQIQQEWIQP